MEQRKAATINDASISNTSKKQPPKSLDLQTSSSQSADTHNHLSPAELYISMQVQKMVFNSNDPASETLSNASSTTLNSHSRMMNEWRERQIDEIYKSEPHRYRYGTHSSSSNNPTTARMNSRADTDNIQTSNSLFSKDRKMRK